MTVLDLLNTIFSGLTLIAVVFAVLQLIWARVQSHRDFENLYVQRYWTIVDRFSDKTTVDGDRPFSGSDVAVAVSYLQLCEDQVDMRKLGRVTGNTWAIWQQAMLAESRSAKYQAIMRSLPHRFPSLRQLSADEKDPYSGNKRRAVFTGLR